MRGGIMDIKKPDFFERKTEAELEKESKLYEIKEKALEGLYKSSVKSDNDTEKEKYLQEIFSYLKDEDEYFRERATQYSAFIISSLNDKELTKKYIIELFPTLEDTDLFVKVQNYYTIDHLLTKSVEKIGIDSCKELCSRIDQIVEQDPQLKNELEDIENQLVKGDEGDGLEE
jgi:hypothetical protein